MFKITEDTPNDTIQNEKEMYYLSNVRSVGRCVWSGGDCAVLCGNSLDKSPSRCTFKGLPLQCQTPDIQTKDSKNKHPRRVSISSDMREHRSASGFERAGKQPSVRLHTNSTAATALSCSE